MAAPSVFGDASEAKKKKTPDAITPFKLKYAPGFGMFNQSSGNDIVDIIDRIWFSRCLEVCWRRLRPTLGSAHPARPNQ